MLRYLPHFRFADSASVPVHCQREQSDLFCSLSGIAILSVSRLVRIGDDGLIDFAYYEVFNNRQLYTGYDRFTLFDGISYYLHDTSSRKAEKKREDVRKFFSDAAGRETKHSCLLVIDRELGKTDNNYRKSYEREEVLKKLESSKAERYKKYASEQLRKLRKLPKESRTHISIGKNMKK
ncbi:MAG: hypothetical protein GY749_17355 [Desulfobacteraceae bacterium]|nr:hypothetical protein [Desulfobacteraceae bacterium]